VSLIAKKVIISKSKFVYCGTMEGSSNVESVIAVSDSPLILDSVMFDNSKGVKGIVRVLGDKNVDILLKKVIFNECRCYFRGAVNIENRICPLTVVDSEFRDFPIMPDGWGHCISAGNVQLTLNNSFFSNCMASGTGNDRGNLVRFYPANDASVNIFNAEGCTFEMTTSTEPATSSTITLCGKTKIGRLKSCEFRWDYSGTKTDVFFCALGTLLTETGFDNCTFAFNAAIGKGFRLIGVEQGLVNVVKSTFDAKQRNNMIGVAMGVVANKEGEIVVKESEFSWLSKGIVSGDMTVVPITVEKCKFVECSGNAIEIAKGTGNVVITECRFDEGTCATTTAFISITQDISRSVLVTLCCFKTVTTGKFAIDFAQGIVTLGIGNCFPHTSQDTAIRASSVSGECAAFPCTDCTNPKCPDATPTISPVPTSSALPTVSATNRPSLSDYPSTTLPPATVIPAQTPQQSSAATNISSASQQEGYPQSVTEDSVQPVPPSHHVPTSINAPSDSVGDSIAQVSNAPPIQQSDVQPPSDVAGSGGEVVSNLVPPTQDERPSGTEPETHKSKSTHYTQALSQGGFPSHADSAAEPETHQSRSTHHTQAQLPSGAATDSHQPRSPTQDEFRSGATDLPWGETPSSGTQEDESDDLSSCVPSGGLQSEVQTDTNDEDEEEPNSHHSTIGSSTQVNTDESISKSSSSKSGEVSDGNSEGVSQKISRNVTNGGKPGEQKETEDDSNTALIVVSSVLMAVLIGLFVGVVYAEQTAKKKRQKIRDGHEIQQKPVQKVTYAAPMENDGTA
jgi:hypothetical protein